MKALTASLVVQCSMVARQRSGRDRVTCLRDRSRSRPNRSRSRGRARRGRCSNSVPHVSDQRRPERPSLQDQPPRAGELSADESPTISWTACGCPTIARSTTSMPIIVTIYIYGASRDHLLRTNSGTGAIVIKTKGGSDALPPSFSAHVPKPLTD